MNQEYFKSKTAPQIYNVMNTTSLCSAVITIATIIILGYFRRQALNRVTLRFQGLIALIDIAKHLMLFKIEYQDNLICKIIGFSIFFTNHMYVFTNVLIALNIQLVYINNILPKPVFEIFYILGATGAAFIIDLIPIGFNAYGINVLKNCFLRDGLEHRIMFKVFLMYVSLIPGLVYCIVIFFWVTLSLYFRRNYLEEKFPSKKVNIFGESVNGRNFIEKLYYRMALYPISSVISFFPLLISNLYFDLYGGYTIWSNFIFEFCIRLSGIMNLISLMIDPHFQLAIKSIYKNGFVIDQTADNIIGLKNLGSIKKEDEEYLISFPGEESVRFEDYIKFL